MFFEDGACQIICNAAYYITHWVILVGFILGNSNHIWFIVYDELTN